jgi:dsDNA-specific endonuclease/ATPase MutS2
MGDMSDSGPSLNEIIDELREVLEAPDDLDEELRAELRSAAEEILEALDPDHERELSGSLRDRLTNTLERFEKSHPKITETIGRLADALSDMGI